MPSVKFNRFEWAGSIGDVGTDLPLLIAMITASQLDVASTFILFGLMQILTGFFYGLPMPMQPLKAMAVIVIAQQIPASMLYTGGFVIGFIMLFITLSGLLERIRRWIPHHVMRGIQMGLGFTLIKLVLMNYLFSSDLMAMTLALAAGLIYYLVRHKMKFPAAFIFLFAGIIYALLLKKQSLHFLFNPQLALPKIHLPELASLWPAFLTLALPQLPLSLTNSVLATEQTVRDLFPDKKMSLKKIGFTYSVMNLIAPFFSGVPACHGCGGLAGHYGLGARTGGSVVIYGSFYLITGLFFSDSLSEILHFFPTPLLGVILFFEALVLLSLSRDLKDHKEKWGIALMVGALCVLVPQGFLVGLLWGLFLSWFRKGNLL